MEQTNLPQTATSSVLSLLLSNDKLNSALQAQDPDFVQNVFLRHYKGMGIEKAVASKSPTFRDVQNFFDDRSLLFWLRFHIAETFAFLGIYDQASVYQIRQTAELIVQHEIFGQFTLDEFLCFLQRFKQGRYGKIYQSRKPNPQEFLMCLTPFWNELCYQRGKQAEKERVEELSRQRESNNCMTYDEWLEYKKQRGEEVISESNPLLKTK